MVRIPAPTRCVYFHIVPTQFERMRFDIPMEFELLADDCLVRRIHRLYGSFATERLLLDSDEHLLTLQLPDGTVLQQLRLPAGEQSYLLTLSEAEDFALTRAQPMAQPEDTPELDRLASLLTGKLMRTLNPASPFSYLYKDLVERDLDYLWFEFWETAMLIRFMPKSGHIPDLKKDFDSIERYDRVKGVRELNLRQTLQLEAQIENALTHSEAAEKLDFFQNGQGFLCARPK